MIWFYLQGLTFTKVPKIKSLIIVGGAKFRAASLADKAYSTPIQCPSLHFLGTSSVSSTYSILQIQYFVIFLLMFCDGYGYYGYTPIIKHLKKKKIIVWLYLPFFFFFGWEGDFICLITLNQIKIKFYLKNNYINKNFSLSRINLKKKWVLV